jgi:hypothetical protein
MNRNNDWKIFEVGEGKEQVGRPVRYREVQRRTVRYREVQRRTETGAS